MGQGEAGQGRAGQPHLTMQQVHGEVSVSQQPSLLAAVSLAPGKDQEHWVVRGLSLQKNSRGLRPSMQQEVLGSPGDLQPPNVGQGGALALETDLNYILLTKAQELLWI